MNQENEKYKKVVDILRNSKPELNSPSDIEREVMRRIQKNKTFLMSVSDAIEFLFGWVYIGWVRTSLITLAMILVMVFIYQQGTIIRRIDILSRQIVTKENANKTISSGEIERLLTIYKSSGKIFSGRSMDFSEKQINDLVESLDELRIKYKDLENLIDNDPELKKIIEEKLIENNRTKINL